jgi:hypothetical protein
MEFHALGPLLGSCFLKSDALLPLAARDVEIQQASTNAYLR